MVESHSDFLKIAITRPDHISNESDKIVMLLDKGNFNFCHIRKPTWGDDSIEDLIKSIPSKYYDRIKLHSAFHLVGKYGLGGVHLNHRHPYIADKIPYSKSLHSLEELRKGEQMGDLCRCQYVTLSPIFDSISKEGYHSKFNINDPLFRDALHRASEHAIKVIALGGVKEEHFDQLKLVGFQGAALLGSIW